MPALLPLSYTTVMSGTSLISAASAAGPRGRSRLQRGCCIFRYRDESSKGRDSRRICVRVEKRRCFHQGQLDCATINRGERRTDFLESSSGCATMSVFVSSSCRSMLRTVTPVLSIDFAHRLAPFFVKRRCPAHRPIRCARRPQQVRARIPSPTPPDP